jgi:lipopolysaccharide biosynthesis glycosyltransferase
MDEKIQVLVGSDENCIVGLVATLTSVAVACDKTRQLKFNIMNLGFDDSFEDKIYSFFTRYSNVEINIIQFNTDVVKQLGAREFEGGTHSVYARLFSVDLLDCDKCIYIDSDILVTKDISELWDMNIDKYALCAVPDSSKGRGVVDVDKLSHDCPFEHEDDISNYGYYNSGLLVCNLKRWRELNFLKKALELMCKYNSKITSHDQTILNFVFRGQIFTLSKEWNYIPWWTRDMKELSNLHFTSKHKPWHMRLYLPEEKMWYALYNSQIKPYWDIIKETQIHQFKDFLYVVKHWLIPAMMPEVYCFSRRLLRNDTALKRDDDLLQFRAMRKILYFGKVSPKTQRTISKYCDLLKRV